MHAVRQCRVLLPLVMALFLATGTAASAQLATPVVPTETPASATPASSPATADGLPEADDGTDMLLLLNGVHQSITAQAGDSVLLETIPNTLAVALFSHPNCTLPFQSVQPSGYSLTVPESESDDLPAVWSARPVDPTNPERVGDCLTITWTKREIFLALNGEYRSISLSQHSAVVVRYFSVDSQRMINPKEPVAATVYQGTECVANNAIHELPVLPVPNKDYQSVRFEGGFYIYSVQAYSTQDPSRRGLCLQIHWLFNENPPPATPVVDPPTVDESPEPGFTATIAAPSPDGGGEHSATSVAVTSLPETGGRIARPVPVSMLLLATATILGAASVAARFVSNRRSSRMRR